MWKWVTVLCLGMYVTLMVFGGEGYDPEKVVETVVPEPVVEEEPVAVVAVAPAPVPDPAPEATPEVLPEPAPEIVAETVEPLLPAASQTVPMTVTSSEIEAIAPVSDPITISPAPQATISRETTLVDAPKPDLPIWRVTGSRVNLRADSNAQAQIVGRTVRGDSAEVIELLPNGWAKVYIIDSGIEAFMSAQFIAPEG